MKKSLYLAGSEYDFNDAEQFVNFIVSQNTTPETMKTQYAGMELVFENNKLSKAIYYEDKQISKRDRTLNAQFLGTPYLEIAVNKICRFVANPQGLHQLCGELPADF